MHNDLADTANDPRDIRPVVPLTNSGNIGLWIFLAVLIIGGLTLFNALETSRQSARAPATFAPGTTGGARIASPAPIAVPERFLADRREEPRAASYQIDIPPPIANYPPSPRYTPAPVMPNFVQLPSPEAIDEPRPQSRVVFETRGATPANLTEAGSDGERVTAGRFANPSRTIPKGTIIPAVLETALDSTRPGGVRALVQRDIYGFDGSRLLIQRGSRLYGEYEADLQPGQKRAMVQWTRLIRPDGVTIALDSPASDPLGRAGLRGKVDSKFFQRFGGAILQSVLDIGVGIATREATDGVIVALPGSTQNVNVQEPGQILPTLKVKHGTSVSVFVARDLDFSTVEL